MIQAEDQERTAGANLRSMLHVPAAGEESVELGANSSRRGAGELERLINADHRLLDAAVDNLERRFWFVGIQVRFFANTPHSALAISRKAGRYDLRTVSS